MSDPESCNDCGNQAFKAGEFAEAVKWYTKAIDLDGKETAKYLTNRANAQMQLKSYSEAGSDAKYALEADAKWAKVGMTSQNSPCFLPGRYSTLLRNCTHAVATCLFEAHQQL